MRRDPMCPLSRAPAHGDIHRPERCAICDALDTVRTQGATPLALTSEPPTKAGWYWFEMQTGGPWPVDLQPVEVSEGGYFLMFGQYGLTTEYPLALWAGPIPEPSRGKDPQP